VAEPSRQEVAVVPFHQAEEEVAAVHRNRAVVEVCQPTRHRVQVQRLCFCVVVRVQAALFAVCPAVSGPHLQRVCRGRDG
jgi:hypothetical protein